MLERKGLFFFTCMCLFGALTAGAAPALAAPEVGAVLPEFQLLAPEPENERLYLGLEGTGDFSIAKVNAPFLLIEIVGVYCPQCHIQAPLFNTLFSRIRKNPDLDGKLRMMAIAIGATPMEVDYMRGQFNMPFPLLRDPEFKLHKMLGEPRTPFTVLVNRERKVVFAHLGVINDIDSFLSQLEKLTQ